MKVILSIDQSTQGTKALVWSLDGRALSRADLPHRQIVNEMGWVSHDLNEIWQNVKQACIQALEKACVSSAEVAALGISNQRETACCWDRRTGEPLCDAIVWQCARAEQIAQQLRLEGHAQSILQKTGMELSPYFSAAKFRWMIENIPAVAMALKEGNLCCGTVDAYLLFRMTNGSSFATDLSNASRTQLMNLDTLDWDEELVRLFGLSIECLPQIRASDACFGQTALDGLFTTPVPIHAMLGDSHAALYAHRCVEPGSAKVTYGTGSSIMMNAGTERPRAARGVAVSMAWGMNGEAVYCLEGNINYTGAVTTWLVNDLKLIDSPKEAGAIASSLQDNAGVYLVPAFSGLGAPHFNAEARAAIVGMTRACRREHIVRAAEECIAYQIHDVVQAIDQNRDKPICRLHADGGPTRDLFLMQFQSDILNRPLVVSQTEELSAAGAAYCAGIASGLATEDEMFSSLRTRVYQPQMRQEHRGRLLEGWQAAVRMIQQ